MRNIIIDDRQLFCDDFILLCKYPSILAFLLSFIYFFLLPIVFFLTTDNGSYNTFNFLMLISFLIIFANLMNLFPKNIKMFK